MRISQRWTSIITSTVLASVVVTTGATTVLAEESGEDLVITETQEETSAKENPSKEEAEAEAGLIPGDFFYFIEVMQEKVKLSLTFNDFEKSQLLAEFAAERIAEANSLIQEEKYEEAGELLRAALEYQEESENTLESDTEGENSEGAGTTEETEEGTTEETTEGTVEEEGSTDESTEVTEDEVAKDEEEEANEEVAQVKVKLANNITALSAVLAKIENPKAQAAIMKNIEKSFAKLANKIEKRASKVATKPVVNQEQEVAETVKTEEKATLTVEAPVTDEKQDLSKEEEAGKVETVKENSKVEKKADKAQQKADRTTKKAEEKARKELEKAEKKAEKFINKAEKHENKANHGKGNGNN